MLAQSIVRTAVQVCSIACLLLLSTCVPGFGQAARRTSIPRAQRHEYRHQVEDLEDKWRDAMLKSNSAVLDSLLADDYTAISANGAILTKEQTLANLRSGALQLTELNISDRKIRIYGSTAVVTSLAALAGNRDSEDMSGRYRYTRVYVRNSNGQWKIVSFEASRIQEPGERNKP
jgi:ketosteroid isomerase-like protein